ncbi:MAG: dihydroorotate dehydrogenase electron transfer subunit, partial [Gammaproteobacteria bacterium]
MGEKTHRGTIALQEAEVISHQAYPEQQYILRLHAPRCAELARPGSFAHLSCGPELPMRRPLSIMRASAEAGWVDFLYKVVGLGTGTLATRKQGETVSILGPIGNPFHPNPKRPRTLLIGGGVGIPPMIFLAETLHQQQSTWQPLVLMGSEIPFPFTQRPSEIMVPGIPDGTIAAMPLLEDWGMPSRLASLQGYPGCYEGHVTELARHWLNSLDKQRRLEVEIFACGPIPMLAAAVQLAREYELPCQVSLEEFMACGVGGCAGC